MTEAQGEEKILVNSNESLPPRAGPLSSLNEVLKKRSIQFHRSHSNLLTQVFIFFLLKLPRNNDYYQLDVPQRSKHAHFQLLVMFHFLWKNIFITALSHSVPCSCSRTYSFSKLPLQPLWAAWESASLCCTTVFRPTTKTRTIIQWVGVKHPVQRESSPGISAAALVCTRWNPAVLSRAAKARFTPVVTSKVQNTAATLEERRRTTTTSRVMKVSRVIMVSRLRVFRENHEKYSISNAF